MNKLDFLQHRFVSIIATLNPSTPPRWGKMTIHQMVEHMTDSIQIATEKIKPQYDQPEGVTEKMKAFMMSEKPFKENTPNPLMPETPLPTRFDNLQASLDELQTEIDVFVEHFNHDQQKTVKNPFFGELTGAEWAHLLHKHAMHHLSQFGYSPV